MPELYLVFVAKTVASIYGNKRGRGVKYIFSKSSGDSFAVIHIL